jgi:hypothetical protein
VKYVCTYIIIAIKAFANEATEYVMSGFTLLLIQSSFLYNFVVYQLAFTVMALCGSY